MNSPIVIKRALNELDNIDKITQPGMYALRIPGSLEKNFPYEGTRFGLLIVFVSLDLVTQQIIVSEGKDMWIRTNTLRIFNSDEKNIPWTKYIHE